MRFTSPLEHVRVAAPCPADWDQMRGDERVRFCDQCKLNVYNLSAMTKREAERLVMSKEDRLCIRFYRRADGTILTRNCPVGLRALKRRVSTLAGAAFAAVTTCLVGLGVTVPAKQNEPAISPAPMEAQGYSAIAGGMSYTEDPFGEQLAAGTLLGGSFFLFFYPLLKLKERIEAKRRAALHIWVRP